MFSLQRVSIRHINRALAGAADAGALQQAARDIRGLAANMLGQGVAAEQVTSIITALNDALTRRILELEMGRHDLQGIAWCWLAFGSEGRCEQTLSTDQDNGLLFAGADGVDPAAIRGKLLPFARNVNRTLDACGFNFIQQQRLRQQVAAPQGAGGGANRVNPDALNEVDRRILKEALRQARKLQSRLALDYHL